MLLGNRLSAADKRRLAMLYSNNAGGNLRQQLLDGAPFLAELTHTAVPQRAATGTTATFTRATTKTVENNDGYLVTLLAGEIGFPGARRVRNLVTKSEDLTSGWAANNAGSVTATTITFTAASNDGWNVTGLTVEAGRTYLWSALMSATSGTKNVRFRCGGGALSSNIGLTTTPTRVSAVFTAVTAGATNGIYNESGGGAATVNCTEMQLEDITGRADKTTPSEYASVGVVQRNVLFQTDDITNATWTKINGGTGTVPVVTSGQTDPNGGSTAFRVQTNCGAGGTGGDYSIVRQSVAASTLRKSIYVKSNTGSSQTFSFTTGTGSGNAVATTSWQRLEISNAVAVFDIAGTAGTAGTTQSLDLLVWHPQAEVAAEATEYQAVGGTYIYHGSFVDGVKCFPTDLSGNPLPTAYTYDAVSLNGVAGTYVSTPDSVAASITGDIDIRVKVMLTDWTAPAAAQYFVSKSITGGQYSYDYYLEVTTGKLVLRTGSTGATLTSHISSVATGFVDGDTKWVRATRSASTGDVYHYTSPDGTNWTQLGTVVTSTPSAIFNGTDALSVGAQPNGASPVSGKIYAAQIYNGINGTLAVDFNASRYAGGTTLTGSTGETWTLQGNAVIHPTNNPMLGYSAEGARTDLCLQSNAFTTTWAAYNTGTATQNATGPDGGTTAWTITDDGAAASEGVRQSITLTAATHTVSIFVKKTTGAQSSYPVIYLDDNVSKGAACTVDTTNGVATVWTAYTGLTIVTSSASCASYNEDCWRVSLTLLPTAAAWFLYLFPAATSNATQSTGTLDATVTGSAVFYGAQVELGSFASSYIPTTTIAVARNADVLTYSSAGNILGTAGWVYTELRMPTSTGGNAYVMDVGSNRPTMFIDSLGVDSLYDGTATRLFSTYTFGDQSKICNTWGGASSVGAVDGAVTTYGFDGDLNTGAAISIGCSNASASHVFGTIRNVRIGQRQLSASEMQAVTS